MTDDGDWQVAVLFAALALAVFVVVFVGGALAWLR